MSRRICCPERDNPKPEVGQRLIALLDAIDEPVSIASAIRDRDGRILDFRIEFVNEATARWGARVGAIRLGDGYMGTWRLQSATPEPD